MVGLKSMLLSSLLLAAFAVLSAHGDSSWLNEREHGADIYKIVDDRKTNLYYPPRPEYFKGATIKEKTQKARDFNYYSKFSHLYCKKPYFLGGGILNDHAWTANLCRTKNGYGNWKDLCCYGFDCECNGLSLNCNCVPNFSQT